MNLSYVPMNLHYVLDEVSFGSGWYVPSLLTIAEHRIQLRFLRTCNFLDNTGVIPIFLCSIVF